MRNYGNQFYHDILSRGLAYRYLDWLLNAVEEIRIDNGHKKTQKTQVNVSSEIGTREISGFDPTVYANSRCGVDEAYDNILAEADDDVSPLEKNLFEKIYNGLKNRQSEMAVMYDKIETNEGNVWPAIFWPESQVAIFWNNQSEQFENLRTYNWHCFYLTDNTDIDKVVSLIKEA